MGDLVEIPHKLMGSIIGEDLNAILDPVGGQQAAKDQEKAMTAQMNEAQALLAAAATGAETPKTLMTPTAMPTADSDAQRAARRKSLADQAKRRGRQSTILTGNDDALGAA